MNSIRMLKRLHLELVKPLSIALQFQLIRRGSFSLGRQ